MKWGVSFFAVIWSENGCAEISAICPVAAAVNQTTITPLAPRFQPRPGLNGMFSVVICSS